MKRLLLQSDKRPYWDRWRGGIKIEYFQCLAELDGAAGRSAAFDQLADDSIAGRERVSSLLVDLTDMIDVVVDVPNWAAIWELLAEQLAQFRDYHLGQPATGTPAFPSTEEELIAYIYLQAMSMKLVEPSRQARIAAVLGREAPGGHEVFFALVDRLLVSGVEGPAEAIGLLMAAEEGSSHRSAVCVSPEAGVRYERIRILL